MNTSATSSQLRLRQIGPLDIEDLRLAEFLLCHYRNRAIWWENAAGRASAVGKFLSTLQHARDVLAAHRGYRSIAVENLSIVEIMRRMGHGISASKLGELLRGASAREDLFTADVIAEVIRYSLLGTVSDAMADRLMDMESRTIVERIVSYFVPSAKGVGIDPRNRYPGQRGDFFDEEHRFKEEPARAAEAISPIRQMAFIMSHDKLHSKGPRTAHAEIIRSSSSKRFLQVTDDNDLTYAGQVSLDALRSGVRLQFIFPGPCEPPTDADASAHAFAEHCRKCLPEQSMRRLALTPCSRDAVKDNFWSGDYLSRLLRLVYHAYRMGDHLADELRQLHEMAQATRDAEHCKRIWNVPSEYKFLIMSRDPKFGPCAWCPSSEEISDFRDWVSAMTGQ